MRYIEKELKLILSTRPIPKHGYLVCTGQVNLRLPPEDRDQAAELRNLIGRYIKKDEWSVICLYDDVIYITVKRHLESQNAAREYMRQTGNVVYDCAAERVLKL